MRLGKNRAAHNEDGRSLDQYLGAAIHDLRTRQRLTISDVARKAGISSGMISKIERAQTSTSLDTLAAIADALGVTLANLFQNYRAPVGGAQLVKKGAGMEVVRRGTRKGHTYHLLAYDQGPRKIFEPFLVTLTDKSEIFPGFEHPGTELIYLLRGKLRYRHGKHVYTMSAGDCLTFRGKVPHGPAELISLPIQMLAIIMYHEEPGAGAGRD
jgi:transcriptional regulator with XRE-family HTH domain